MIKPEPMRYILLTIILLTGVWTIQLNAQDCPCCRPEYQLFDFWLGDWTVYDSTDLIVGHNLIEKAQKGCLLVEHWTSASGNTGTSYNYFRRSDSTWNQVWVDEQGGVLELKGTFTDGAMVLRSQLVKGRNDSLIYHRITWKPSGPSVIQTWEVLDESMQVKSLLFKGFYRKK